MNFLTNIYHYATKEKLETISRIRMNKFSLNHYTIKKKDLLQAFQMLSYNKIINFFVKSHKK